MPCCLVSAHVYVDFTLASLLPFARTRFNFFDPHLNCSLQYQGRDYVYSAFWLIIVVLIYCCIVIARHQEHKEVQTPQSFYRCSYILK